MTTAELAFLALLLPVREPAATGARVTIADTVKETLARVYSEYSGVRSRPDVGRLVLLDQELRKILPTYVGDDYVGPNGRRFIEATYLRPGYEDLGISTATFAPDLLTYSGKLLRGAHNVNPRSSYRKHTLYATLFPNGEDAGDIPDLRAARTYLREFPQGPFAADVYLELAHFRDDLFKVIRGILAGEAEALEYKYDCYAAFLTKQPYREQLRAAQKAGIANYRRVLALRPADELARESLAELSKGSSEGWFFCPD